MTLVPIAGMALMLALMITAIKRNSRPLLILTLVIGGYFLFMRLANSLDPII